MNYSPPLFLLSSYSAYLILFTTQHIKSQVISPQRFNFWKVHSQALQGHSFTETQPKPLGPLFLEWKKSCKYPQYENPPQSSRTEERGGMFWWACWVSEGGRSVNSPQMFSFCLVHLISNSPSSAPKLQEATVMSVWDTAGVNIWTSRGGPSLLAGTF